MKFDKQQLAVYFIAGSQNVGGDVDRLIQIVERACQNRITMFQYREKDHSTLSDNEKLKVAIKLKEITAQYNVSYIIDDDIDLMKKINADGIHVGQDDTKIERVIAECPNKIIGLSTHSLEEVRAANNVESIDYIGIGPIFATQSKLKVKLAIGIDELNRLYQESIHPAVAIGGIKEDNAKAVLTTNVDGVSVISDIIDSNDFKQTINHLKGNA
ncbi:Thiamine-phosphate synthase [Apilactobacillus kunkeei]|uniref:thiamine phosphate synthase n=1 Tax=Apilactobacillus kunkeei TaxID=148814 RepID=UPI00200B9619|nr:thiamine phosphate synthase [Apilactobacillus kunkeei]MCK8634718.1 thiamine phosphate synthase [Apilactobacillus kunkeei]CAI2550987.1 Thiamine-phosphate synthase [Apilactobacillus kunkeei]CAI2551000.1 Thiamine-phosphate synthase [Apilactobacillus kunkeei]CAI2551055.1 Thiamine-phosphate synthase [Apilactobacillus kunkeei]CAI2551110.1 Thiamine-phosphate synthase [Apilactobacillus kunkeei]